MSPTHTSTATSSQQQYYLITNVHPSTYTSYSSSTSTSSSGNSKEIDLNAGASWQLPYTIDDSDLMFDGKPLNMLYEENRTSAERRDEKKPTRGRSRQCKK